MVKLALGCNLDERNEQQIDARHGGTDCEDTFVAERVNKSNADERTEAQCQGCAHGEIRNLAAMKLGRNNNRHDRAGDCAHNADGHAGDETHQENQRKRVGKKVGSVCQ